VTVSVTVSDRVLLSSVYVVGFATLLVLVGFPCLPMTRTGAGGTARSIPQGRPTSVGRSALTGTTCPGGPSGNRSRGLTKGLSFIEGFPFRYA
jgi:hypothetical protein